MTTERLSLLNRIVDNYSDQEKENLEIYYLEGLMAKIAENQIDGNDNLIEKIDSIIERLPRKTNTNKLVYDRKLLNSISNLKSYIKEKYNFVPKGYYKKTNRGVNSGFESQGNLDDLTNKKLNNTPNVSVNQKVVSNNEKHKDKNYKTVFYWIMAILVVLYLLNTLK